jgi:hypothetical protein
MDACPGIFRALPAAGSPAAWRHGGRHVNPSHRGKRGQSALIPYGPRSATRRVAFHPVKRLLRGLRREQPAPESRPSQKIANISTSSVPDGSFWHSAQSNCPPSARQDRPNCHPPCPRRANLSLVSRQGPLPRNQPESHRHCPRRLDTRSPFFRTTFVRQKQAPACGPTPCSQRPPGLPWPLPPPSPVSAAFAPLRVPDTNFNLNSAFYFSQILTRVKKTRNMPSSLDSESRRDRRQSCLCEHTLLWRYPCGVVLLAVPLLREIQVGSTIARLASQDA